MVLGDTSYHLVEAGPRNGRLVLMSHGFPESWHSWRYQLNALGDAGYHAVAVDMLGYGKSDSPAELVKFSQGSIAEDFAAIAAAFGHQQWVAMGHDWGAPTAWTSALQFPEKVSAVIAMSIPFGGRSKTPPLVKLKQMFDRRFFYINYFQEPGVAESELEANVEGFIRAIIWAWCGENPDQPDPYGTSSAKGLLEFMPDPGVLPSWLDENTFAELVESYSRQGLRGPLSYYRNIDQNWSDMGCYKSLEVKQPSLFLYGGRDPCTQLGGEFDRMPSWVNNLQIEKFADSGHWLQQEAPEAVNASILKFLANQ